MFQTYSANCSWWTGAVCYPINRRLGHLLQRPEGPGPLGMTPAILGYKPAKADGAMGLEMQACSVRNSWLAHIGKRSITQTRRTTLPNCVLQLRYALAS